MVCLKHKLAVVITTSTEEYPVVNHAAVTRINCKHAARHTTLKLVQYLASKQQAYRPDFTTRLTRTFYVNQLHN